MKLPIVLFILAVTTCFAQSDRAEAQRNPFTGNAQAIAAGKTLYSQACVDRLMVSRGGYTCEGGPAADLPATLTLKG